MRLDMEVRKGLEMNNWYDLKYFGYVEEEDDIWFFALQFNALVKMNKLSGKIRFMIKFPEYNICEFWLYTSVCKIGEQLIFTPHRSKKIAIYNTKSGEFSSIDLSIEQVGIREYYFMNAFAYHNYVYMFPVDARCIVRYNVMNKSIKYIDGNLEKVLSVLPKGAKCFIQQYETLDDKVYIPFAELNAVAIFDLREENLHIKYLDIEGGCTTINYFEGYFYLAARSINKIYRWDNKTGEVVIYNSFPKKFVGGDYLFSCACIIGKKIIYLPLQSNMIISFDTKSGRLTEERRIFNVNNKIWMAYFIRTDSGKTTGMLEHEENLCLFNYKRGKLQLHPYFMQDNLYNRKKISNYILKNMYCDYTIVENKGMLEDYINLLADLEESILGESAENLGYAIYNNMYE